MPRNSPFPSNIVIGILLCCLVALLGPSGTPKRSSVRWDFPQIAESCFVLSALFILEGVLILNDAAEPQTFCSVLTGIIVALTKKWIGHKIGIFGHEVSLWKHISDGRASL